MKSLPPIDAHAHLVTDISPSDVVELSALVFAATRSLDEADQALNRSDKLAVWGVGCHPGLVGVQRAFDVEHFTRLIHRTPLVSEIGLDGKSRVPMQLQRQNLQQILGVLQREPRIASIHSYAATKEVVDEIEARPVAGSVLHWWLGDPSETERAVRLGCYFSVNASSARKSGSLDGIPIERILTETDHPFGDRASGASRRPGNVANVERLLAAHYGTDEATLRRQLWRNLRDLATSTNTMALLPRDVRVIAAAV